MPIIVQIDAYDPVAAAPVTLRMASDDDAAVCHLNGQIWWPVLDKLPVLAMDFFGGEFGQVTTAAASLSLAVEPWPDFARYAFPDARLQIWHGDAGAVWAGYTLRFDGRVTAQPVIEDGRAQIGFAVDDKWLDTPMLATYAGTGGAEGPSAMKGTVKPIAIGAPMGVPGVMLDPVKSILQLSAYGAIESVDVPLERLARQFGSPIADYATYAALDAAAVPAGQWATAKAVGLVKMGAPPYGKLCFLMKGDKGGVDGWVRRPGAIIKRFAGLSGGAAKVSETAVDALDTARPYDLSVYYDRQITAREAVQEIAASVNAVAGVSLTGQLIVVPIQINGTGLTLRADGSSLPIVGSVRALGISAPWWRLAIGAQPFFDVHGQGEYVTSTMPEAGATNDANLDDPTQLIINEKIRLIPSESVRAGRKVQLRARMVALGLSVTALDNAEASWLGYRDSISPSWSDTSQHSTINRTTWNSLFVAYDGALDAGDKAVSEEDAKRANWPNVSGTGKPEDNATVGAKAGTNLLDAAGATLTDSAIKNSQQLWAEVGGTGRPEDFATVGARVGINTRDQFGNLLSDNNLRNEQIGVNASGQFVNPVGTGAGTEISNSRLRVGVTTVSGRARARLFRDEGVTFINEVELPSEAQNADQQWADVSGAAKPADYATSDITLIGKGTGIVIKGNNVSRPTGGGAWTAGSYTSGSYTGGAFCSFSFSSTTEIMAGLNSDPLTENGYGSLDHAFYCPASFGSLSIYENGAGYGGFGAFTASTVFSIIYDNEYVRYLKDGVEVRSVFVGAGKKYHFDSSLVAGTLSNVRFGPYSAANAPVSFINANGQSSDGNTVFKRANATGGWNSKSYSQEVQKGTAVITWKMTGPDVMVGLHEVGNTNPDYPSLYASIYRSGGGAYVYESGGNGAGLGSVDDSTVYRITYDGTKIEYFINNSLVRTLTGRPAGLSFQAGVAIYHANGSVVSNIQFGAYTDNAWSSVAGTGRPEDNATVGARAGLNLLDAGGATLTDSAIKNSQQLWAEVSGSGRPADNATVGAVAGTNLTDSLGNSINSDAIRNNLVPLDWWKRDAAIPWGTNGEYNRIVSIGVDVGDATPPKAGATEAWYCQEVNNDGNQGGGWDSVALAPLDKNKTYRFVVPIRRLAGTGSSYWGCYHVADLNTTNVNTNPYFCATVLPAGKWFLFVGYIFPAGSTGNTNDSAGIWDCSTGTKYFPGNNFNHLVGQPNPIIRAYQYYCSQNASQLFGRPMVNVVDGTEPSLREYFSEAALLNNLQRFDEIVAGNGKPENNADVTITAQVTPTKPDDVTINADYLGAILPNQFNKTLIPGLTRGGVSVRTDNRASYTLTNVTGGLSGNVSVDNTNGSGTKGAYTVTACPSSGTFQMNIFWDSVLVASYVIKFTVVAANAPLGGGGSGGTKSGSVNITGQTISSTSFVSIAQINNLTKAAGETIKCNLPAAEYELSHTANSTRNGIAKFQYSPTGANSWTDVGTQVSGSSSTWNQADFSSSPGSITVNQTVAPSNAAYDIRLVVARNASGGGNLNFTSGTMSVIIEP